MTHRTLKIPGGGILLFVVVATAAPASLGASGFEVVINEIHYHPAGGSPTSNLEYLELHNAGNADVDISGWEFREGIVYQFPSHSVIRAGEYVIVSPDPTAAASYYQLSHAFGPYAGRLDNGGEVISLVSRDGQIIHRIHYLDEDGWPSLPDGQGPSLEFTEEDLANDVVWKWLPSVTVGGTPGRENSRRKRTRPA